MGVFADLRRGWNLCYPQHNLKVATGHLGPLQDRALDGGFLRQCRPERGE